MNNQKETLTYKKIFIFWYPLAAAWLMMAVEGPFLSAVIARLAEPKFNLAAYGVAYSLGLMIEAPIVMLMTASTALCKNRDAFLKLQRFSNFLNIAVTAMILIISIPPVFHFVANGLIGLPPQVEKLTHTALLFLIPWPAAIGYRRFYQGILIRSNLTRRVAYGTVIRLLSMSSTALALYSLNVTGAYVGGAALGCGVVCEALATRIMAHKALKKLRQKPPTEEEKTTPLTYKSITKFYYPLALMTTLSMGIHPMVTFFMGQSRYAIESLAVLPVVNAMIFAFRAVGLSYQEVIIALLGNKNEGYTRLRNFAVGLGVFVLATLGLIAFTPMANIWFHHISGLSLQLSRFAYTPTRILVLLPLMTVLISFQRSILVKKENTGPISRATIIETLTIFSVLYITINYFNFTGAIAAAIAYVSGRILSTSYLLPPTIRAIADGEGQGSRKK